MGVLLEYSVERGSRVMQQFDSQGSVLTDVGWEMLPAILEEILHFGASSAQGCVLWYCLCAQVLAKGGKTHLLPVQ